MSVVYTVTSSADGNVGVFSNIAKAWACAMLYIAEPCDKTLQQTRKHFEKSCRMTTYRKDNDFYIVIEAFHLNELLSN